MSPSKLACGDASQHCALCWGWNGARPPIPEPPSLQPLSLPPGFPAAAYGPVAAAAVAAARGSGREVGGVAPGMPQVCGEWWGGTAKALLALCATAVHELTKHRGGTGRAQDHKARALLYLPWVNSGPSPHTHSPQTSVSPLNFWLVRETDPAFGCWPEPHVYSPFSCRLTPPLQLSSLMNPHPYSAHPCISPSL